MKRFLLRLLLALSVGVAALYPIYVIGGNWYLRHGGLDRLMNRRPERMRMVWESAWTAWPGVVHVRGFQVRSQSRAFQWWLAVDRGTIEMDFLGLRDRELRVAGLHGSGTSFRLRRRLDVPPRSRPGRPDLYPPIPGLTNPPDPKPEAIYPRGPRRRPWHIRFRGVELDEVREVWIEEYRFAGRARVAGGFDLSVRERLEVDPTRLEVAAGGLSLGAGPQAIPVLLDARGRIDGRITTFSPVRFKGWDVFRFASGRADVDGRVKSLDFLDLLFQKTRWVDLEVGPGRLAANLRIQRGQILAGSRLEARPNGIAVGFLDYRVQGIGAALWEVVSAGGAGSAGEDVEGRLALAFDDFRLERRGFGTAHVRGKGLRITAASEAPRLGSWFTPKRFAIDMPQAEVADLRFYNAYLPQKSGMALTSGSGRMSARFAAAAPDWRGSGEMRLTARGVGALFNGRRLRGNLGLHTRLLRADLDAKDFDISGTDFELTDVRLLSSPLPGPLPPPWWARAHLDRAVITPGEPVFLRAQVETTLSNPRPLFALVAPEGKSRLLGWVDDLLNLKGAGGTARVVVGDQLVAVDDLAIAAGGKAQVLGRLRIEDAHTRGVLYASYGNLDVGLEVAGDKRDWKILRPKQWFENYPPFE